jgi:hypothetical protein
MPDDDTNWPLHLPGDDPEPTTHTTPPNTMTKEEPESFPEVELESAVDEEHPESVPDSDSEEIIEDVLWLEARSHNWNKRLQFVDAPIWEAAPKTVALEIAADMRFTGKLLKIIRKDYPPDIELQLLKSRHPIGSAFVTRTQTNQFIIFLVTRQTDRSPTLQHNLDSALSQLQTLLQDQPQIHTIHLPRLADTYLGLPWTQVRNSIIHYLKTTRQLDIIIYWPRYKPSTPPEPPPITSYIN